MRRPFYLMLAGGLLAVALAALIGFYLSRPSVLRIAVVHDSEDAQLVSAIAQVFAKEHEQIRLRPVFVNDANASAAALEADNADLAVVRSDVRLPLNGQTLALLHRNAALLLSTRAAHVASIADLRGRSIGVVRGTTTGTGNLRLLETILTQYEIDTKDVTIVELARDQVYDALTSQRVAAILTVGSLNLPPLRETVTAVMLAGGEPVFVPVTEAKAMAQRAPVFEAVEIVRGAFGGSPPKPAEPFETLGVSVRLMAANTMADGLAGEITHLLFANRPSIAQIAPLANQIEAPSTDRGSAIPVHPGAAAYLDDEQETFFEKYSDGIYIGAMILSVLGSAAAAAAGRFRSTGGGGNAEALLADLLDLMRRARLAPTLVALADVEAEADDVVTRVVSGGNWRAYNPQTYQALTFAIEQVRRVIADHRLTLSASPVDGGPPRAERLPDARTVAPMPGRAAAAE